MLSESTKPSGAISTGSWVMLRQTLISTKRFFSRASASSAGSRSRTRCGPDFSV